MPASPQGRQDCEFYMLQTAYLALDRSSTFQIATRTSNTTFTNTAPCPGGARRLTARSRGRRSPTIGPKPLRRVLARASGRPRGGWPRRCPHTRSGAAHSAVLRRPSSHRARIGHSERPVLRRATQSAMTTLTTGGGHPRLIMRLVKHAAPPASAPPKVGRQRGSQE